jgi:two-component system, chemotaxis family, CheB/CheR fusion protein
MVENSAIAAPPPPDLAGLQLLVVEDRVDLLAALKLVLEGYGAEVVTVTTAREAIASLNESPSRYDIMISDIGLPEEDGYFLIQQVRSRCAKTGGQIPAIALTAYTSEADRQRAIEAGFQRHMAKPFDFVQLGAMVADLAQGNI